MRQDVDPAYISPKIRQQLGVPLEATVWQLGVFFLVLHFRMLLGGL